MQEGKKLAKGGKFVYVFDLEGKPLITRRTVIYYKLG